MEKQENSLEKLVAQDDTLIGQKLNFDDDPIHYPLLDLLAEDDDTALGIELLDEISVHDEPTEEDFESARFEQYAETTHSGILIGVYIVLAFVFAAVCLGILVGVFR